MENNKVNPWVRADLEQHSDHTLGLIPPERRDAYEAIVDELVFAGEALNEAMARFSQAKTSREAFFKGLAYE